ncbi:MAG: hypothetical protein E7015_00690 [Alphaproteobacteria bacterium]|nr:hypothetical protein [Alphaproteobacteria bacterium]
MKLIKIVCVALCFFSMSANGMEEAIPFRVGFEFQMNGRLCEWALHNFDLQKKSILSIKGSEKDLFHVELDGPDIEFVTEPFSNTERSLLCECMKNIRVIVNTTKSYLDVHREISFVNWKKLLSSEIGEAKIVLTSFFDVIKEQTIKKLNPNVPWEPSWQPQITVQHPLKSTIFICNTLFSAIPSMKQLIEQSTPSQLQHNTSLAGLLFLVAHEVVGMTNSYLIPLHSDHILDLAMALAIYFYGRDLTDPKLLQLSIEALSDPKLMQLETHTLMRPYLNCILEQNVDKQAALFSELDMRDAFIQRAIASTANLGIFLQIANNAEFMYKALLSRDTFESFETVYQFDAKRWMNFMSRRPFSHMFAEIIQSKSSLVSDDISRDVLSHSSFSQVFNQNISFADQLPSGFYLANYAEQFFDVSRVPINLIGLLPYFDQTVQGSWFLKQLLQNGIFSTTMFTIMNIDKEVPDVLITPIAKALIGRVISEKYTGDVLSSIEHPQKRNFLFIKKEGTTIKIDASSTSFPESVDLLSPPFILDISDAMGYYREGILKSTYEPEIFGSAIVEFRNIQQAKQLKSERNVSIQAGFLTVPDFVEEEALNVFDILTGVKLTI